MKRQSIHNRTAILKVLFLLCVYGLHLVFFQAAMASNEGTAKYFKTYLSHKADHSKGKPSPAGFYLKCIKHSSSIERPTVSPASITDDIMHTYLPVVMVNEFPPVSKWAIYSHLPEDAFKLFQRIRVILV